MEDRGAGGGGGLNSSIVNLSGYVRLALIRGGEHVFDGESSSSPASSVCRSLESASDFLSG